MSRTTSLLSTASILFQVPSELMEFFARRPSSVVTFTRWQLSEARPGRCPRAWTVVSWHRRSGTGENAGPSCVQLSPPSSHVWIDHLRNGVMQHTVKLQIFVRYLFSYFRLETGSYVLIFVLSRVCEENDVETQWLQSKKKFSYDIKFRTFSKVRNVRK